MRAVRIGFGFLLMVLVGGCSVLGSHTAGVSTNSIATEYTPQQVRVQMQRLGYEQIQFIKERQLAPTTEWRTARSSEMRFRPREGTRHIVTTEVNRQNGEIWITVAPERLDEARADAVLARIQGALVEALQGKPIQSALRF